MKFVYKILLWTIIIMAVAFGLSGYFFVHLVFETSLNREVTQALDDSNILQFAFETAALNRLQAGKQRAGFGALFEAVR